MASVILLCGKLCCGKTTYARRLQAAHPAVLLSVDELMLNIFGPYTGEKHDEYAGKIQRYLFQKSLEILAAGADVILDWGFWTEQARAQAKQFYRRRGIPCRLHYLEVSDEVWQARIRRRNASVAAGAVTAYPVDANLAAKFQRMFQPPQAEEVDVWIS